MAISRAQEIYKKNNNNLYRRYKKTSNPEHEVNISNTEIN